MSSIARRVALAGVAVLAGSLLGVGGLTGGLLHLRAVEGLDRALAAAAHARARPAAPEAWQVYHDPPDVHSWLVEEDDPVIPPRIHARVLRDGKPLLKDMGDERLLIVPAERGPGGEVVAVAAIAPRITLAESVGPFAAIWLVCSTAVTAFAAVVLATVVRRSFRPLDRARREVARVVGLGQGQRLDLDAPIEIRPLLAAVNGLLDRLDGAFSLQARFTAEAAHELRTPVAALLGEIELALVEQSDPRSRALLASLNEDVERLRRIVEALTALARVDAGDIDHHRQLVRASDVARDVLQSERAALRRAGCAVDLHLDDDPELEVHPVLLELALANLLRNAARHAPGAAVTLTVRADGERVVFEVRDTGPGVGDDAEALFDRFARGAAARAADPTGLGLGLPLAREVARRHGGDCVLRPLPLGGTRAVLEVRRP